MASAHASRHFPTQSQFQSSALKMCHPLSAVLFVSLSLSLLSPYYSFCLCLCSPPVVCSCVITIPVMVPITITALVPGVLQSPIMSQTPLSRFQSQCPLSSSWFLCQFPQPHSKQQSPILLPVLSQPANLTPLSYWALLFFPVSIYAPVCVFSP